jgi:hypothetical protein
MRAFLVIALTLGLCGCSNWDGSFFDSDAAREATPAPAPVAEAPLPPVAAAQTQEAAPAPMPQASVDAAPRPAAGHCVALARQRASDAAYQGEDEETQHSVYDRTYAECMDWDSKHAL